MVRPEILYSNAHAHGVVHSYRSSGVPFPRPPRAKRDKKSTTLFFCVCGLIADMPHLYQSFFMANKNLNAAKVARKDEFYTQLEDIERELQHYWQHFRGKIVLCNCDDPYESNFFKYFASRFNQLGLKKLICTCYNGSAIQGSELPLFPEWQEAEEAQKRIAHKLVITEVTDMNGDGAVDMTDVEILIKNDKNVMTQLKTGDFRSQECKELLREADIVVTNPPFSLFREYVAQMMDFGKKFLIIGNVNAITCKEIFPLFRDNKLWLGPSITSGDRKFNVPDDYPLNAAGCGIDEQGKRFIRVKGVRWFTNLEHNRRHEIFDLVCRYSPDNYPRYDNYDAINVDKTSDIPCDYAGAMGVPITFLDKYNPDQFEILNANDFRKNNCIPFKPHGLIKDKDGTINGKTTYVRILIRNKHPQQL